MKSMKRDAVSLLEDLTALRHLALSHSGITSLQPLRRMDNLEFLELTVVRQLESLEGLEALPKLRCLYLDEAHKLTDLRPIAAFTC